MAARLEEAHPLRPSAQGFFPADGVSTPPTLKQFLRRVLRAEPSNLHQMDVVDSLVRRPSLPALRCPSQDCRACHTLRAGCTARFAARHELAASHSLRRSLLRLVTPWRVRSRVRQAAQIFGEATQCDYSGFEAGLLKVSGQSADGAPASMLEPDITALYERVSALRASSQKQAVKRSIQRAEHVSGRRSPHSREGKPQRRM